MTRAQPLAATLCSDAELWRDRRGRNRIVIAREHALLARALAQTMELELLDGPAGSVAALGADDVPIVELLAQLEFGSVDPHVERWVARSATWQGTIEVDGPRDAPVFLVLGENERLPTRCASARAHVERAQACR